MGRKCERFWKGSQMIFAHNGVETCPWFRYHHHGGSNSSPSIIMNKGSISLYTMEVKRSVIYLVERTKGTWSNPVISKFSRHCKTKVCIPCFGTAICPPPPLPSTGSNCANESNVKLSSRDEIFEVHSVQTIFYSTTLALVDFHSSTTKGNSCFNGP